MLLIGEIRVVSGPDCDLSDYTGTLPCPEDNVCDSGKDTSKFGLSQKNQDS